MLSVLTITVGFSSAPPVASAAARCSLAPTRGTALRDVDGRTYAVHVPPGLKGPAPLLISLHGTDDTAASMEAETGWSDYSAIRHFIVAYPQGIALAQTWHFEQASFDVAFLTDLAHDVESNWCVDSRRVYAEGWSNGGIMAQRLACDASETFAAVAGWESTDAIDPNPATFSLGSPCTPRRPVSVGIFQGQFDPISNAIVGAIDIQSWVGRDNCPKVPVTSTDAFGTLVTYRPCAGGTALAWRTEFNTTHQWPTGYIGADLRDRIWDFLSGYSLP